MMKPEITSLSLQNVEAIRPVLQKSASKPYRYLNSNVANEALAEHWLTEIMASLDGGAGTLFAITVSQNIQGLVVYADLPWDSKVFGKRMAALKTIALDPDALDQPGLAQRLVDHATAHALSTGSEFLLCKTYTSDMVAIHALERAGFLLMDTLLEFGFDALRHPLANIPRPVAAPEINIRLADDKDHDALVALARMAFHTHFGRFHSDGRIPRDAATQTYVEWVNAAYQGYADWIVVAEVDGKVAGYSIWKKPAPSDHLPGATIGHYSIAAVHPDYAGRGLFGLLTYAGMERLEGIADFIEGPTHVNNYGVQRGYQKLGWKIMDARHSFHKWLAD